MPYEVKVVQVDIINSTGCTIADEHWSDPEAHLGLVCMSGEKLDDMILSATGLREVRDYLKDIYS